MMRIFDEVVNDAETLLLTAGREQIGACRGNQLGARLTLFLAYLFQKAFKHIDCCHSVSASYR